MKAKSLILTMVVTLLICSSATAQSHIDKIVDELEQKGVDLSKVVKRNPETKKIISEFMELSFYSKDGKYANRLKEAFKKDAEDAVQEIIKNHGNSHLLIFIDGKKKASYQLEITPRSGKNPLVKLSIIIKDGNNNVHDRTDNRSFKNNPLEDLESLKSSKDIEHLSDDSLLNYITSQSHAGKTNSQIVTDLMKKGVKIEDVRHIRDLLQNKK